MASAVDFLTGMSVWLTLALTDTFQMLIFVYVDILGSPDAVPNSVTSSTITELTTYIRKCRLISLKAGGRQEF